MLFPSSPDAQLPPSFLIFSELRARSYVMAFTLSLIGDNQVAAQALIGQALDVDVWPRESTAHFLQRSLRG